MKLPLTDREHAILAVSVTELVQQGYDPFGTGVYCTSRVLALIQHIFDVDPSRQDGWNISL